MSFRTVVPLTPGARIAWGTLVADDVFLLIQVAGRAEAAEMSESFGQAVQVQM